MGSDVGVSSSRSAVSAVAGTGVTMGEDGVAGAGCLVGAGVRFFDAFDAGRLGHVCESCPACLQRGQAFSDPGQDAITLKPHRSKKGVAERVFPPESFKTRSQRLEIKGVSLYLWGAIATTSPYEDQKERSVCSKTIRDNTGTLTSLIGIKVGGVPAGGRGCAVKCLQTKGLAMKSCCASAAAKQTSSRKMSALGTKPRADSGRADTMSPAQACLYVEGSGTNAECREETGGRCRGAANCSRFTAHSVGWNAVGFFFRTTCAQVGPVAMVLNINWESLYDRCIVYMETTEC